MKNVLRYSVIIILFTSVNIFGQDNNLDALSKLFSQSAPTGTARMQALGGNHAALGADVSSASGNPAGLGFYTRSEFSFTPAFQNASNSSSYITAGKTTGNSDNFNIANIGVVFGGQQPSYREGWRGNFAVTYSRQNTFYSNIQFGGRNNRSSIANKFAEDVNFDVADFNLGLNDFTKSEVLNNIPNFDLTRHLYYWSFLVEPTRNTQGDLGFVATEPSISDQKFNFESTGRQSQWNLSYGGTANEKVYLGIALAIPSFRYESTTKYDEQYVDGKRFNGLLQTKLYSTEGSGINLSGGVIIKPNDMLRFGLSLTTPTWYDVNETISSTLNVDVNTAQIGQPGGGVLLPSANDAGTLNVINTLKSRRYTIIERNGQRFLGGVPTLNTTAFDANYQLRTPFKANIGAAIFFKKKGFISADVEYLAYKGINMSTETGDRYYSDYTEFVRSDLKNVLNLKVGGEYRLGQISLRGGYNYIADPYTLNFDAAGTKLNRSQSIYSAGVGYRTNEFYVDITGMYSQSTQNYIPYALTERKFSPTATIDNSFTRGVVSFGVFF
jgi:hypothetical protein